MYFTPDHHSLQLAETIGRGGEATVYQIAGQSTRVAKIYHDQLRDGYDQKLAWMIEHPPHDPTQAHGHASIAWPLGLIFNEKRVAVGYQMARIQGAVPLLEVFNPRLRAKKLPNFTGRYLYRTARNLAQTLSAIHEQGYVVGDLNESNVLVNPQALVTLIDTDSFQVREKVGARTQFYPCLVGKPEYTSPELQGLSFQEEMQQPRHDNFALGVLIFQLLMGGSHPFRARWLGDGDPPAVEERIRDGCFPHIEPPPCEVAPPQGVLPLSTLAPPLADLVRDCFVAGHRPPYPRPTPDQWVEALTSAENQLVECAKGHFYGRHLTTCPHCEPIVRPRPKPTPPTPKPSPPDSSPQTPFSNLPLTSMIGSPLLPPQPAVVMQPKLTRCPSCDLMNPLDEIYCQRCLSQLGGDRLCRMCQQVIPARSKFCPKCGHRFV